jgi:hypothetical protein
MPSMQYYWGSQESWTHALAYAVNPSDSVMAKPYPGTGVTFLNVEVPLISIRVA